MMEITTVNEVIIQFVQENKCLYDKSDKNFKNNQKKKCVWSTISDDLIRLYGVEMSAEEVEKRWSSLRDMFSRECRRQKLQPSGSGYEPVKEWNLYKNMQFLSPYIAHRKTKTSLLPIKQNISQRSITTRDDFSLSTDSFSTSCSPTFMDHNDIDNIDPTEGKEVMASNIDRDIIGRPSSTMSTCSSSNTQQFSAPSMSSSSTHIHSPVIFQPIEKITPELDRFAKRRKYKDEKIEEDIQKSTSSISTALKSIENLVCNKTNSSTDGYMLALHEGLKHVPGKNKTQCFIEMLQIIKKYEEWQ